MIIFLQKRHNSHISPEMHDNWHEPIVGALRRAEEETFQEVQVLTFMLINLDADDDADGDDDDDVDHGDKGTKVGFPLILHKTCSFL